MNEIIKKAVLENEMKLLLAFPEYSSSIKQYISKLKTISYDASLYFFIQASFRNKEKQEKAYNRKGFLSSRQLIDNLKSEIDFTDSITLESLSENKRYTSLDICSLAQNYNLQVGMYYCDKKNCVIIKSTTDGDNRMYADHWLDDQKLYYYMQKEKDANREKYSFSNKPNRVIYKSLLTEKSIPIYVFYNTKKSELYMYAGVFQVEHISDDKLAFILSRKEHRGNSIKNNHKDTSLNANASFIDSDDEIVITVHKKKRI